MSGAARILELAEALADDNGVLPLRYYADIAAEMDYTYGSVKTILSQMRHGRYGPELAERARAIGGKVGRAVNRPFVERLMAQNLAASVILERLNVVRAELGLRPTTRGVVVTTMSQIRNAA